ncbi:putative N-terminal acetyltransferase B complex catalytic subunit NAA20 [Paratrimastix pyriformis]|uniref:N-terminal acetyltransferase B complex catalytic subunit NAA20 n=1 Tax=Paratrimastix pyriformis TaxID=342808 RepID=A0ABQ8UDY8_9EUKA|nr:putative N-terminal acetyltransferase B complex catalytic subunit NAA20 [Paratrimastix pyriformis]
MSELLIMSGDKKVASGGTHALSDSLRFCLTQPETAVFVEAEQLTCLDLGFGNVTLMSREMGATCSHDAATTVLSVQVPESSAEECQPAAIDHSDLLARVAQWARCTFPTLTSSTALLTQLEDLCKALRADDDVIIVSFSFLMKYLNVTGLEILQSHTKESEVFYLILLALNLAQKSIYDAPIPNVAICEAFHLKPDRMMENECKIMQVLDWSTSLTAEDVRRLSTTLGYPEKPLFTRLTPYLTSWTSDDLALACFSHSSVCKWVEGWEFGEANSSSVRQGHQSSAQRTPAKDDELCEDDSERAEDARLGDFPQMLPSWTGPIVLALFRGRGEGSGLPSLRETDDNFHHLAEPVLIVPEMSFPPRVTSIQSPKMASIRPFVCTDLFRFNNINMDSYTETYNLTFYLEYLARWPEYCVAVEAPGSVLCSYLLGKSEGQGERWHAHVTAVTVAPDYRRLALGATLMHYIACMGEIQKCFFVDLYVRASNKAGVGMYNSLGYIIYRTVLQYYSGEEDAYDMHIALSRDKARKSMVPFGRPITPQEADP